MTVYIVLTLRGVITPRNEYKGIYLTAEEAKAHAKKFYDSYVLVYDLDNPRKTDIGALIAVDEL